MALKPFSYPLPETRFFHAGRLVYKFRMRYGNLSGTDDPGNAPNAAKELEEAIRVILGNLDDLHPFSTDHFTIFPYLSKWERVSKVRFQHGAVQLTPYPYICTVYLEANSFQQSVSLGKEAQKGSSKLVKERNERTRAAETVGTVKRRRVEDEAEPASAEADTDRTGAGCVHSTGEAKLGSETSYSEETERGPVERDMEKNAGHISAEGEMQPAQPRERAGSGAGPELKGRSFSRFCRSVFFSPLQHLFGGNK